MARNEEEERLDRDEEANYWREYDASTGNCLLVFVCLVVGAVAVVGAPLLLVLT